MPKPISKRVHHTIEFYRDTISARHLQVTYSTDQVFLVPRVGEYVDLVLTGHGGTPTQYPGIVIQIIFGIVQMEPDGDISQTIKIVTRAEAPPMPRQEA